jgi:hypothetical protein
MAVSRAPAKLTIPDKITDILKDAAAGRRGSSAARVALGDG